MRENIEVSCSKYWAGESQVQQENTQNEYK